MDEETRRKIKIWERETQRKFYRLIFFITLIGVTTVVTVDFHNEYLQYYHIAIRSFFAPNVFWEEKTMANINTVVTNADLWNYIEWIVEHRLLYTHHARSTLQTFWIENIMVGKPALRQIRVPQGTCVVNEIFERYFNACYASYEPGNEEKNKTFKGTPYMEHDEYPVNPKKGYMTTYIGPGYVQYLTYNQTRNLDIVHTLKEIKWIDRGTRLVVIELEFFNRNLNIFANLQIFGEKLTTGNILTSQNIRLLPVRCLKSSTITAIISGSLFYAVVVYSLSSTIWDLIRSGVYPYISNIWNLVNLTYTTSAYIAVFLAHKHMVGMNDLIRKFHNESSKIFIDDLCTVYETLRGSMIVCVVLAWVMLFRFIGFNTIMMNFSYALRKGYPGIMGFSLMFMVVYVAFAALGFLLFSKANPAFSTVAESFDSVMRMIMTDFQYVLLEKADPVFGPIYFFAFILFMFFVLLNTFLAVIGDSYVTTREKKDDGLSVLKTYFNLLRNFVVRCIKKRREKKRLSSVAPGVMDEDEEFKEYFGQEAATDELARTNLAAEEVRKRQNLLEKKMKSYDRLAVHISRLEGETELLIEKMDRVLHKAESLTKSRE